jgi:hypothetical protein
MREPWEEGKFFWWMFSQGIGGNASSIEPQKCVVERIGHVGFQ